MNRASTLTFAAVAAAAATALLATRGSNVPIHLTIPPAPKGNMGSIRMLGQAAGLPPLLVQFLTFVAYGESRGNNLVGLGDPSRMPPWTETHQSWLAAGAPPFANAQQVARREATAAVKAYERNDFLHGCLPGRERFYTFGSGGWFGMLPPNGLAVFRGTTAACLHPWSVFEQPAAVVMAMGMMRRLQGWPQYQENPTPLGLRVGWVMPARMNDRDWIRDNREARYRSHAAAVGLPASFLTTKLPRVPAFNGAAMLAKLKAAEQSANA
jgi:hypothetical protein